jgi:hypothetical protein
MGRTFDTIRLDLHHPGYKISLFASSVIMARDGVVDHHYEGNNFHGAYASFDHLIPHATLDSYVLWRLAPGTIRLNENQGHGHLNEVTAGLLFKGKLPFHLDYDIEMDKQTGSLGPYSIRAWAGHWNAGRTLDFHGWNVRPFFEANYATGTKDPNSATWSTFDQQYPSSHDKLGFADLIGWRNIKQFRTGFEETLAKKWKIKQTYQNFWLATINDGLYSNSGALAFRPTNGAGSHVGQELDVIAECGAHRVVTWGFGWAHFFTGEFLNKVSPGKDYNYPFVWATYHF